MGAFVSEILAFPTVIFTFVAALTTLYWLFVLVTGFDVLEGGGEGLLEGAAEGAVEGAGAGALDGVLDAADGALDATDGALAAADGALEGAFDAADGGELAGTSGGVLHALHLRDVPVTMALSMTSILSWGFCAAGMRYLAPLVTPPIPVFITGTVVALGSLVAALPVAGALARPLGPIFQMRNAKTNQDLVGLTCMVRSGKVAAGAEGQAEVTTRGSTLLITIRSDVAEPLTRGDAVLITEYDRSAGVYAVTPMRALVGDQP